MAADKPIKKVVLAYSGGLDTSIILKWLQTEYGAEVVTFTADLGQGEEIEPARAKALAAGVKPENIFIEDVREEFVRDFVFPMFRANTVYEGQYLLGTSIARPLIAKRQIEIARATGADAVSHGATGKGNDQLRFELAYAALDPDIRVIAPWREWELTSRTKLLEFAEKHQIPIAKDKPNFPLQKICLDTGKPARSDYQVLERLQQPACCRVRFVPQTGRTHQLRIHSLEIGHPILGCDLYKNARSEKMAERLMLHASELQLDHPSSGERIYGHSPCPFKMFGRNTQGGVSLIDGDGNRQNKRSTLV